MSGDPSREHPRGPGANYLITAAGRIVFVFVPHTFLGPSQNNAAAAAASGAALPRLNNRPPSRASHLTPAVCRETASNENRQRRSAKTTVNVTVLTLPCRWGGGGCYIQLVRFRL